jgi:hypothetical protein
VKYPLGCSLCSVESITNSCTDFRAAGRAPASLETCCRIYRELHLSDRKGRESTRERIREGFEGELTPAVKSLFQGLTDFVTQTISDPLREGHHFDQSLGGVAGLFENMRANTQVSALAFPMV